MSEHDARRLYQTALSEAATIAAGSVSQGFEDSRQKSFSEFESFLGKVGQGLSVDNATDLDVIAFVQGWWVPAHIGRSRTRCNEGEKVMSASSVKGVIQQLAKSYSILGRRDDENPAKQESVRSYCEGYRNHGYLHARGVRKKRAKVFKERKVDNGLIFAASD
jgi:hypothetical protein